MSSLTQSFLKSFTAGTVPSADWGPHPKPDICEADIPKTIFLDGRGLAEARALYQLNEDIGLVPGYAEIELAAQRHLSAPQPDCSNSKKIQADADSRPEQALDRLSEIIFELSIAGWLTRKTDYQAHAVDLLSQLCRSFEDKPPVGKLPDLNDEHACGSPGKRTAEMSAYPHLWEAVSLLEQAELVPAPVLKIINDWSKDLLTQLSLPQSPWKSASRDKAAQSHFPNLGIAGAFFVFRNDPERGLNAAEPFISLLQTESGADHPSDTPYAHLVGAILTMYRLKAAGDPLGIRPWTVADSEGKFFQSARAWMQQLAQKDPQTVFACTKQTAEPLSERQLVQIGLLHHLNLRQRHHLRQILDRLHLSRKLETLRQTQERQRHTAAAQSTALRQLRGNPAWRFTSIFRRLHRKFILRPPSALAGAQSLKGTRKTPVKQTEVPKDPSNQVPRADQTFVLYRILGNDLYPRHEKGQTRRNLKFILQHEPPLKNCEKRWVVNRIADPGEAAAILSLLEAAGQAYLYLPFQYEAYARAGMDYEAFPKARFWFDGHSQRLGEVTALNAEVWTYRLKNLYAMNNNGARNAALADGQSRARWILPFDGNCYFTESAWQSVYASVSKQTELPYFIVPMARIADNTDLLNPEYLPEATEEPQIIFRNDATALFDERQPYGRRPKVELLWRLGVKGSWDRWREYPWDYAKPPLSEAAGQFAYAGWTARLNSGMRALEQKAASSFKNRGLARAEAIIANLQSFDQKLIEKTFDAEAPIFYREGPSDHPQVRATLAHLLSEAEKALTRGPYSVTAKPHPPASGDNHDYWHPAPYWWPNPKKKHGYPYIRRDGERVPGTGLNEANSERYDRSRLQHLFDDTLTLALAWRETQEKSFATHAVHLLRHWFVEEKTRMNPHLRYAQTRGERPGAEGSHTGIIETKDFYVYLDAVRILKQSGALDAETEAAFRQWLTTFRDWLRHSAQGKAEANHRNNHGVCFDLQEAAISAYLGDIQALTVIFRRARGRLSDHFDLDGSQPHELDRTQTLHYCVFNLQSWLNLCHLAQACGDHLHQVRTPRGRSLRSAFHWLMRHLETGQWPFPQTQAFDWSRTLTLAHTGDQLFQTRWADRLLARDRQPSIQYNPMHGIPPHWMLTNLHLSRAREKHSSPQLLHLVFVRFAVGVSDPFVLEYQCRLLAATTLPSLRNQTTQHFCLRIQIDKTMKPTLKQKLQESLFGFANAALSEVDMETDPKADQARVIEEMKSQGSFDAYLLTSLDSGSALSIESLATVQSEARAAHPDHRILHPGMASVFDPARGAMKTRLFGRASRETTGRSEVFPAQNRAKPSALINTDPRDQAKRSAARLPTVERSAARLLAVQTGSSTGGQTLGKPTQVRYGPHHETLAGFGIDFDQLDRWLVYKSGFAYLGVEDASPNPQARPSTAKDSERHL